MFQTMTPAISETNEQYVERMHDLTAADNAKPAMAHKCGRNQWAIYTICSMRSAILSMAFHGEGVYLLRKAPRGEYVVTTKEFKAMLKKERSNDSIRRGQSAKSA
jgi:hypothetical protein